MDEPKITLLTYPYVVVRIACDRCNRRGGFRLARLAAKYGVDYPMDQLLADLAHRDCSHRPENQRKGKRWAIPEKCCQAYYPDLERPMPPPDLPSSPSQGLRVVEQDGTVRRPRKRAANV